MPSFDPFGATWVENAKALTPKQRALSFVEMWLAILVVVAHNVYHSIPNEVPILCILALASFRLSEGSWGSRLYKRRGTWMRTILLALCCAVLLLVKEQLLELIGQYLRGAPEKVSSVIA